jgi:hypothetical protein
MRGFRKKEHGLLVFLLLQARLQQRLPGKVLYNTYRDSNSSSRIKQAQTKRACLSSSFCRVFQKR